MFLTGCGIHKMVLAESDILPNATDVVLAYSFIRSSLRYLYSADGGRLPLRMVALLFPGVIDANRNSFNRYMLSSNVANTATSLLCTKTLISNKQPLCYSAWPECVFLFHDTTPNEWKGQTLYSEV